MDWNAAIEKNREALKRILATLVAMAGLAGAGPSFSPCGRRCRGEAETDEGYLRGGPTLPRHLHRAVLRLLRPAEAAARRLVIVAARGLALPPPAPPRPRKPKPRPIAPVLRSLGIAVVLPHNIPHPEARGEAEPRRTLSLPLLDPLPRFHRSRPVASGVPRISFPGFSAPSPVPVRRPPSPHDPIDATRLALRLTALAAALDDLPKHARRFARWRARRRGPFHRIRPLRPGRPPGWRRKPVHEVHDVLNDIHGLAFSALEAPDTS